MTGIIHARRKRGFTLMEMLIVIAIIAILIVIAIPISALQVERTKEALDMSNLHTAYGKVSESYLVNTYWNDEAFGGKDPYSFVIYQKGDENTPDILYQLVRMNQRKLGWQQGEPVDGYLSRKPPTIGSAEPMTDFVNKDANAYLVSFNTDTRKVTIYYVKADEDGNYELLLEEP